MNTTQVCLAGLPFDAVTLDEAAARVCRAIEQRQRLFLSTPNLNFLIAAQTDPAFRQSVVVSDLSVADGMPIVWMSRLLGLPIRQRVAGSDLFDALRQGAGQPILRRPISVFFFGGPPGVAERAAQVINSESRHMICVGFHDPGYVDVEDMSAPEVIEAINASNADFLVVALGAKKGQAWIGRNLIQLRVPVVSHLGAVVNFVAGTIDRAPLAWRKLGLEWLWRIKEEPSLFARYARDGWALLALLLGRVLPYAFWMRLRRQAQGPALYESALCRAFTEALEHRPSVTLDLGPSTIADPSFFAELLRLERLCLESGSSLSIRADAPAMRRLFSWNGLTHITDHKPCP
jgi:N-acetylglucosaminyldiphosphoundecaprenol N-acetyl-beta-D-mannosaminyltransferase